MDTYDTAYIAWNERTNHNTSSFDCLYLGNQLKIFSDLVITTNDLQVWSEDDLLLLAWGFFGLGLKSIQDLNHIWHLLQKYASLIYLKSVTLHTSHHQRLGKTARFQCNTADSVNLYQTSVIFIFVILLIFNIYASNWLYYIAMHSNQLSFYQPPILCI